ncbi:MAG: rhodanese-like domain-containing protein [Verrucomicrobia bacterium]|nr:rhodanese-like domain-containing protein [Verrucomicrobiota bacterium]
MLPSSGETTEITVAELAKLKAAGSSPMPAPLLVDCREPDEHAICKINGSVLIPFSTFTVNAEAALLDKSRTIIVYCHHGMRSQRATEFLRRKGYTESFSLVGGIDAWAAAVEPDMPRY